MRVTISSSSNDNIEEFYKKESLVLIEYLAQKGCKLNWGSGNSSIMGLCYEGFVKYDQNIYGYTTKKYADEIADLPKANHTIYEDTFDLKKHIFNDADLIICLPGGTGTISEFFAYLEESRSNDNPRDIVLYNVNHQYDSLINLIDNLIKEKFNSNSIYNYFKVINNLSEFKEYFEQRKRV